MELPSRMFDESINAALRTSRLVHRVGAKREIYTTHTHSHAISRRLSADTAGFSKAPQRERQTVHPVARDN